MQIEKEGVKEVGKGQEGGRKKRERHEKRR
jgi:hypothetical protein